MDNDFTKRSVEAAEGATKAAWLGIVLAFLSAFWGLNQNQEHFRRTLEEQANSEKVSQDRYETMLAEQRRMVDESVDNWHRERRDRISPFLLFRNMRGRIDLATSTTSVEILGTTESLNSPDLPTIINAGSGPAVTPSLNWLIQAVHYPTSCKMVEDLEYYSPNPDVLLSGDFSRLKWLPKCVREDRRREIVKVSGTVTITCTGELSDCAVYDFELTPRYSSRPPSIEVSVNNYRPGGCLPPPLRPVHEALNSDFAPTELPVAPSVP